MPSSVYIHIPFCKSKCHYCSFVSFTDLTWKDDYLNSLKEEIKKIYKNESVKTLYFGGGTPSVLVPGEFKNIIKYFNIKNSTEITAELNPDGNESSGLNYDYLKELFDNGINRISIGAQSFDDKILKHINRRHNSKQIFQAVEHAHKAGFDNISLDFIYGLPSQTENMFLNDLKIAVQLGIQHISLYGLTIEKNCYFYKNPPKNIADDDTQADMYLSAVEFLPSQNFRHYEISNFCKDSYESKHNLNYWNNKEYYGFGVAAHGYVDGVRYGNQKTVESYIKNPTKRDETHTETQQDRQEEEIFLGLRKMGGINISEINSKYNINFNKKYSHILKKYMELNLLKKTDIGYRLTPNGILVSNTILAEFLE